MRPSRHALRRLCLWAWLLPRLGWAATLRLQLVDARDGAPVAGAAVVAEAAGAAAVSDALGQVRLAGLPAGELRLTVSHVAYQPWSRGLRVEAGDAAPLLVRLEVAVHALPDLAVRAPATAGRTLLELDPTAPAPQRRPEAILQRLPGLSLQQAREGGRLEARLRGARADQLAVSLDGVPLNGASGDAVDLAAIDWSRVARVELVTEGARPGGELRLSTRPPETRHHLSATSQRGDAGRRGLETAAGGPWGAGAWDLRLAGRAWSGDHPYRDEEGRAARRANQDGGLARGSLDLWGLHPGLRVTLDARQESQGLPGPLHQPPTPDAGQEARQGGARLAWELPRGATLGAWVRREETDLDSPARQWLASQGAWVPRVPFALRTREEQAGLSLRALRGATRLDLRLARHAFRQVDELRDDPLEGAARRLQAAGALEREDGLGRSWRGRLAGGLEGLWDRNGSRRRFHLLGHAQAELERPWRAGELHAAVVAGLSHSRQAPAFRPLFLAESATALGNPHLRPERQSGARAGLRLAAPAWVGEPVFSTELWARAYQDGIIWRRNFRNQYLPVNLSRSSAWGMDAALVLRRGPWSLEGALTLQRLRNEEAGSPYQGRRLPFQPDGLGHARLAWEPGGGGVQLQLGLRGRSFGSESNLDPQGIAGVGLPAWRRLDLQAWRGWRAGPWALRLAATAGNLLDEEMETVDGYPRTGRGWTLDLEVSR